jgi:hypothetical protein
VFHLLTHLYASIAYALAEIKCLLIDTSPKFCDIFLSLKTGTFPCSAKDQVKHINFAMKKAAHLVHHTKFKYNINKTMHQEIVVCRLVMYRTKVLMYRTRVLLECLTKVRR